jgi:hypothetical protein
LRVTGHMSKPERTHRWPWQAKSGTQTPAHSTCDYDGSPPNIRPLTQPG